MPTTEVLKSLWTEGDARVSGVKFTHDDGTVHLRLLLHGFEVVEVTQVAEFGTRLIAIAKAAVSRAPAAARCCLQLPHSQERSPDRVCTDQFALQVLGSCLQHV